MINFFRPKLFWGIVEANKRPKAVKKLHIWVNKQFSVSHSEIFNFPNLIHLELQGEHEIYNERDSIIPEAIGKLIQLKHLTLLNLPLSTFPYWIENLRNLEYLMVRGTDVVTIPPFINVLTKLKELRVENCDLQHIPSELLELKNLKKLGLADTKITQLQIENLPSNLKELNLAGPYSKFNKVEIDRIKTLLPKVKILSSYG